MLIPIRELRKQVRKKFRHVDITHKHGWGWVVTGPYGVQLSGGWFDNERRAIECTLDSPFAAQYAC